MPGRTYVMRQAATLLSFARATSNPELAALLIRKAADLEQQPRSSDDKSPQPPDVDCGAPRAAS